MTNTRIFPSAESATSPIPLGRGRGPPGRRPAPRGRAGAGSGRLTDRNTHSECNELYGHRRLGRRGGLH